MIIFLLLVLFSSSTQISEIPSHFIKSSTKCSLEFDNGVREFYPEYQIAAGERFIAQIDAQSCSVISSQDHDSESSCEDGSCSDQATSVVMVDNTTLYYCYTNDNNPDPMSATLQSNGLYVYNNTGLMDLCLHDVSKKSFTKLDSSNNILYIATDPSDRDVSGYKYHNITTGVSRSVLVWEAYPDGIQTILGMFTRGDYLYTIYLNATSASKITRSCRDDKAGADDTYDIASFTFASIQCTSSIDGVAVAYTRVLSLEYSTSSDKLFLLVTQNPLSSAAVVMCVVDVELDIDEVFDTSPYYMSDHTGKKVETDQDAIDCSVSRSNAVLSECINVITSTNVVLTTQMTDLRWFSLYKPFSHTLLYISNEDRLYIYEYDEDNGSTRALCEVSLWADVSSISIYNNQLYLTTASNVHVTDPFWCSYYGKNPVSCLGSMHPSCSYSTIHSECVPTNECVATDCVQSLKNGSFVAVFSEGYTYTVAGAECINNQHYTDVTYIYHPNTTLNTQLSYRDCVQPTPAPVRPDTNTMTDRELGFLIGLIGFALAFLLSLVLLVSKTGSRLCWAQEKSLPSKKTTVTSARTGTCQAVGILSCADSITSKIDQYGQKREDETAIVQPSTPATPDTPSKPPNLKFNGTQKTNKQGTGQSTIISNASARAELELGTL